MRSFTLIALTALALAGCDRQATRDQIKVVGSSTVYPFTTAVAEAFVNKSTQAKAPVIEQGGTGAGMKLFCGGIGVAHPDIVNASRRMKKSELELCQKNGVTEVMEIQIGNDGIALAESNAGPKLSLTRKDIYLALAANPMGKPNTAKTWKDVNASLPAIPIKVLGPPSTSGTRDAFAELILEKGCEEANPEAKALKDSDKNKFENLCLLIRSDAAYVDSGENDNLIVQKLSTDPNALGIFGYSYLEENKQRLHGVPIDGVTPSYETIAGNSYPGARALYIYVKKQHLKAVPGLKEFLTQYSQMWAPDGPLVKRGLIASPQAARDAATKAIDSETVLDAASLK
ncbi:phosphate ABC transporter substrate-binding protein [Sphingomonas koreensis]|uniref:substrate-binding domain-containing protein n=1 Tax=Sphingomonas koreensis TaxID=93064 RepID=UPI000834EA46|nr:substrate-binding domain-containing protein [Sphingomonas koreensis]PJI90323.1 phosphate transport system substrate-binding protein [Sphingomonas koreensis]RSU61209.1 phosphate ABC transporter substrate-binding protein [Sphingomonas koreensis]RSU69852.1 phosphate ABC transporter substrate-binding protein [Sphingomonas koreensis]